VKVLGYIDRTKLISAKRVIEQRAAANENAGTGDEEFRARASDFYTVIEQGKLRSAPSRDVWG